MSNLAIALAMILATETPDMDVQAVGDLHLPPARRAYGRFQMRKPMLDDLTNWSGLRFNRADSMTRGLDVNMAAWWLRRQCGDRASVKTYLATWNGGRTGRTSRDAQAYVRRCYAVKATRAGHYRVCRIEINSKGVI